MTVRSTVSLICFLALSLAVAGCGSEAATPESDLQQSPLAVFSPLPTATSMLTATPTPTTPAPTATPVPTPGSSQLVVLHTNDNWGETEPCG